MLTFLAVLWTVIKILLFILLGVILLTVLLLSLKYAVEITYTEEGELRARFKLLFFRYTIHPRKKKKINPKKYTRKKQAKRLEKAFKGKIPDDIYDSLRANIPKE